MLSATDLACNGPLAFLTDLPASFSGLYSYFPGSDPIVVINGKLGKEEQREAYWQLLRLHQSTTPELRRFPIKQVITRQPLSVA